MPGERHARRPVKGAVSTDPESRALSHDDSCLTPYPGSFSPVILSYLEARAPAPTSSRGNCRSRHFIPIDPVAFHENRASSHASPQLFAGPRHHRCGHPPSRPPYASVAACPGVVRSPHRDRDDAMGRPGSLHPVIVGLKVVVRPAWDGTGRVVIDVRVLAQRRAWRDWVPDANIQIAVVVVKLIPSVGVPGCKGAPCVATS